MDFAVSARAAELAERVKEFVRDQVIPLEPRATHADGLPPDLGPRSGPEAAGQRVVHLGGIAARQIGSSDRTRE